MKNMGGRDVQLFDSEDGFFYDVLRYPDGSSQKSPFWYVSRSRQPEDRQKRKSHC